MSRFKYDAKIVNFNMLEDESFYSIGGSDDLDGILDIVNTSINAISSMLHDNTSVYYQYDLEMVNDRADEHIILMLTESEKNSITIAEYFDNPNIAILLKVNKNY